MKRVLIFGVICFGAVVLFFAGYLAAHNIPAAGSNKAQVVKTIEVAKIYEGGVEDIVFEAPDGDFYYINRGLEQGFTIPALETQLLNKKVTLRLTNMLAGLSSHIHQLEANGEVLYTELN